MKALCFEVWKNGKRVALAGLPDSGVLSFILSWVGRLPNASTVCAASNDPIPELSCHVGGLEGADRHLEWFAEGEEAPALRMGDEFRVCITSSETPDVPEEQRPFESGNVTQRRKSRPVKCSFCTKTHETMHQTFLRGGLVGINYFICTRCLVLAEQMLDDDKIDDLFHLSRTDGKTCSFCKTKRIPEGATAGDSCICKTCIDRVLKDDEMKE